MDPHHHPGTPRGWMPLPIQALRLMAGVHPTGRVPTTVRDPIRDSTRELIRDTNRVWIREPHGVPGRARHSARLRDFSIRDFLRDLIRDFPIRDFHRDRLRDFPIRDFRRASLRDFRIREFPRELIRDFPRDPIREIFRAHFRDRNPLRIIAATARDHREALRLHCALSALSPLDRLPR